MSSSVIPGIHLTDRSGMTAQWNTRPLGWLPDAQSKIQLKGPTIVTRGREKKQKKKRALGRYTYRKITSSSLKFHSGEEILKKNGQDDQKTCYINFPRLSVTRHEPEICDDRSDANSRLPSKQAVTSVDESSAQTPIEHEENKLTLKKVKAYSGDFFKSNQHLMTVTEHLGEIKISDILAKDISVTNYRISKNDNTSTKVEASKGEEIHEESDLMLKGRQAPVKVKEAGENIDKRTATNEHSVDPERSKVIPDDKMSSHEVGDVWHDDVDNSEDSTTSEDTTDKKEASVCGSLNEEERDIQRDNAQNDYVITEKILRKLQPPVPHVIWPENKFMTQHTAFVYGSPSRLAPVIVPVHSVDCPVSKMFLPSNKGTVCPPNSPTSFLSKEYGFYPVERHFAPTTAW